MRVNEFKAKGKGNMKKRIFSVFLAMLMLAMLSLAVFAGDDASDQPTGEIADATGTKGGSVTVNVKVTNNPGVAGAVFKISFNSDVLAPTEVKAGDIGFDVAAYNTEVPGEVTLVLLEGEGKNVTSDGTAASVKFEVADDAELGTYDISITCETDNVADEDLQSVNLYTASGSVEIKDYTPGDVNGDGEVNARDAARLLQYVANWDVEYVEAALDVNGDGEVNSRDAARLLQYVADWPVELN